jgi:hypothetical protein
MVDGACHIDHEYVERMQNNIFLIKICSKLCSVKLKKLLLCGIYLHY